MSAPKYRPDIDGLRAIAVLAVVGFHGFPTYVRGGFVGVDVFFVISGFLISSIIFSGLQEGRFTFSGFYSRRIKRIFPALAIVLAACLAAGWFLLFAESYAQLGKHTAGGAGFVSNYVLWRESGYFDAEAESKPLLHLWSLGIEEQFYLVWPLFVFLAYRAGGNLLLVTVLVLAASFAANIESIRRDLVGTFYSPFTRFWELSAGSALAYVSVNTSPGVIANAARWAYTTIVARPAVRESLAMLGLLLVIGAVFGIDRTRHFPGAWALVPVLGSFLLILCGPATITNHAVLAARPLVLIGLVSYPFYLWHWPMLTFARLVEGGTPDAAVRVTLILAALILSWGTYRLIETPVRFGPKRRGVVAVLCVVMAAAGLLGFRIYESGGLMRRPVNLTDEAHFLEYYRAVRSREMPAAYREECDFMDWKTERTRDAIAPSCTAPGSRRTLLLWGDSYAQALSLGIRSLLDRGTSLAQVTTSMCRPGIGSIDADVPPPRCERANEFAMARIAELKPDIVILAQRSRHEETDWAGLAARIREAGARHVVVVGLTPEWYPSLPVVVTRQLWGQPYDRVSAGLETGRFQTDRALKQRLAGAASLTYVSLIDRLCDATSCRATVPGSAPPELIAFDQGHYTPRGSQYVASQALRDVLSGR